MRENQQAVEGGEGGSAAAEGRVFTARLYRARKGCRVTLSTSPPPPRPVHVPVRRPARIAIMLALAHKLQKAIDQGKVKDGAEVARLLGVSRARVAQILELALLPVAEQERVLWAEAVDGREPGYGSGPHVASFRASRPTGGGRAVSSHQRCAEE